MMGERRLSSNTFPRSRPLTPCSFRWINSECTTPAMRKYDLSKQKQLDTASQVRSTSRSLPRLSAKLGTMVRTARCRAAGHSPIR